MNYDTYLDADGVNDDDLYTQVYAPNNKNARRLLQEAKKAAEEAADTRSFFKRLLK